MQLSRKKKCKNCMLINSNGCEIGLDTENIDGVLAPKEDCYKPMTFRQEMNYRKYNMAYHLEIRGA